MDNGYVLRLCANSFYVIRFVNLKVDEQTCLTKRGVVSYQWSIFIVQVRSSIFKWMILKNTTRNFARNLRSIHSVNFPIISCCIKLITARIAAFLIVFVILRRHRKSISEYRNLLMPRLVRKSADAAPNPSPQAVLSEVTFWMVVL